MKISCCFTFMIYILVFLNLSECVVGLFPFNLNQILDSVQGLFSSPFLSILKESWSASIDEECEFKCSNGKYPRPNFRYIPKSNGCGVPGIQMPKIPSYIPLSKLNDCCSDHDVCYGTCNEDKNECDRQFKKCLYGICTKLERYISEDFMKGCKTAAKTMYLAVTTVGCKYYLDAQKEACICDGRSDYHYDL